MSRIYIGNLPSDVRKEEVEKLFDKYGPIRALDVKLSRDGRGPAYAFLEYQDPRDADDAQRARDGYDFGGSRIRVEMAKGGYVSTSSRGPPRRSSYRVRVLGLPPSASWQDLKDHMRPAGDVGFSEVIRERGEIVGIVEYGSREDMEKALSTLDGSKFNNRFNDEGALRVVEDTGSGDSYGGGGGGGRGGPRDDYYARDGGGRGRDDHYRGGGGGGGYGRGDDRGGYGGRDRSRSRDRGYAPRDDRNGYDRRY